MDPLVNVILSNGTGQNNKSILKNFSEVTIEMVENQARITWGDRAAAFGNDLPQVMNITTIDHVGNPTHLPFFLLWNQTNDDFQKNIRKPRRSFI